MGCEKPSLDCSQNGYVPLNPFDEIMKTKNLFFALAALLFTGSIFAQDRTTVTATSNDISDNLDLRAVASIFGDSRDLEDFERRLNDPRAQISNLDLNGDRAVDYLRVIESIEGNAHLVIVQAVLEKDVFQDVATIQVERDANNVVQVQVVGDVYMYGANYVYEPVYVTRPVIYDNFWVVGYRPYWSGWYWNYYPSYYYAWAPCPVYRYHAHIHNHINVHNTYNYVNVSPRYYAPARYRANGYQTRYSGRSFSERNTGVRNSYELQSTRNEGVRGTRTATAATGTRNYTGTRNNTTSVQNPRNSATGTRSTGTRSQTGTRTIGTGTRTESTGTRNTIENPRTAPPRTATRTESTSPRTTPARTESTSYGTPGGTRTESASPRVVSTRTQSAAYESPRTESPRAQAPRTAPRAQSSAQSPRISAPQQAPQRSTSQSGGGSRNEGRGGGRR